MTEERGEITVILLHHFKVKAWIFAKSETSVILSQLSKVKVWIFAKGGDISYGKALKM